MNLEDLNIDPALVTELGIEYGMKLVAAIAIFVIGKWVAKALTRFLRKVLGRAELDDILVSFIGNIAYGLLLTFVVIAALSKLGVETTSLAAIIGAAGLAIGLALQGSLSNFAAGVMIIAFRPFKKGDFVEAAGTSGVVSEIGIFTSTLKTPDNKTVIIPNNGVTSGNIVNYSHEKTRRVDMVFGIGYDDDIKKAKTILEKIVNSNKLVLKKPEPVVAVSELADSSVNFVVRPWVKTPDYWAASFEINQAVKETFDKEGISIPFPQQDVHMHNVEPIKQVKKPTSKANKKAS